MKKYLQINHYVSIIALLALIPILIMGLTLTANYLQKGEDLKSQHLALAQEVARDIESFLELQLLALDTLAKQTAQMDISPAELRGVLNEVVNHYKGFSEIYLATPNYQLSSKNIKIKPEYSQKKEDLLFSNITYPYFITRGKPYISPVVRDIDGKETVFIAVPLRKDGTGFYGFVMGTLDLNYLHGILIKNKIYSSGYTVLIDDKQQIIDHPDKNNEDLGTTTLPVIKAIQEKGSGSLKYYSPIYKRQEFASFLTIYDIGWGLWVAATQHEVMMPLYGAAFFSFCLVFFGFLIIAVIRYLLVVNISNPLTNLDNASYELSKGNLAHRVKFTNKRLPLEIETLGQSFNYMAANLEKTNDLLKKHGDELENRVKERTRALIMKNKELAALYAVASAGSKTDQLNDVLAGVLREIMDLFGVEVASIYLIKEDSDTVGHTLWGGECPEVEKETYSKYTLKFSKEVVEKNSDLVVPNLDDIYDEYGMQGNNKIKSFICVPILHRDVVIGVISLASRHYNRFYNQELVILKAISKQLGVVISDVSLFNVINEEHHTLQAVMNSMHEGLILFDAKGKILYVNPVFMQMFLLKNFSWQGRTFQDLQNYKHTKQKVDIPYDAMWEDFMNQRVFEHRDGSVERKDKTYHYLILGFPVISHDNFIGYGFIVRDYTREKEVEALKNSILSTVSHELRTPLTTIRGSAESLLREDVEWPEEEKKEFIQAIVEESKRLRELIDNIMDMSKIESGALNLDLFSYDIKKVIKRVVERFKLRFPKVEYIIDNPGYLPYTLIDKNRIEQVLSNLMENGIKYSSADSSITIKTEYDAENNMVKVGVMDQGIGIDPRYYAEIFQRFYRINGAHSKRTSGSGVGLAITKGIIEAHGGKIWVESQLEEGSQFYFTIPCE